ncbi:MAG TPA: phosphoribosylanthranilate isomerase, partial [Kofleriaceae bacterium]|nr:phosphoribosylanthranilate isomerase [Kofleriaceae bacterium]
RMVVRAGADWIGLNFWPRSKRWINRERGLEIAAAARAERADIVLVGVFVDQLEEGVRSIADELGLSYVQLHGGESPGFCAGFGVRAIKALAMSGSADVDRLADYPACETLLVDTPTPEYGGSGRTFDWSLACAAVATGRRIVLAGGLNPGNVADAVATVRPFGVDVASGVESAPGRKDEALVCAFVAAAKGSP